MKHGVDLAHFPWASEAVPSDGPQPSGAGSPTWPSSMAGPRPSAQRERRDKDCCNGRMAMGNQDSLLTVDEFAGQLRVTRACVRKWILERRVAVVKVGRLVRLPASEIRRIIDDGSRPRAQRHVETA